MATVLIVDDAPIFRDVLSRAIALAGHTPVSASDGAEAVAWLRVFKPSLILLDLQMPLMDGLTFLRQLRANPQTAAVPVALLTSATSAEELRDALALGVSDYMPKSRFSVYTVLETVKKYCDTPHAFEAGDQSAA